MSILEFRRINFILEEGASYMPGDAQKWGQGPGRWNPFGFDYTPAEYEEKQLQEIKHARLAMIALLGLIFQANASGVGVIDQIGKAFVTPDYYAKAGYFLPDPSSGPCIDCCCNLANTVDEDITCDNTGQCNCDTGFSGLTCDDGGEGDSTSGDSTP